MPTDKTHEELIEPKCFDNKFKKAMRDYYTYGFKNYNYYKQHPDGNARTQQDEIWSRLQKLLGDEWSWSETQRIVMHASTDVQSNAGNPLHQLYRFCLSNERERKYFFHTVFALSPEVSLAGGAKSLHIENDYENIKTDDVEKLEDKLDADLLSGNSLSNKELYFFYPNETHPEKEYKNLKNNLKPINETGILVKSKNGRKSLTSRKLSAILKAGNVANPQFTKHLQSMLDFYSVYYPLGELGTFLLDRMGNKGDNPFRFKHEYYMQALNDYDLVDLLYAIENNYWCRITYSNGISHRNAELLCYPIEIRISSQQGREYLAYYEPFSRNYSFLRLEFIKSIKFYADNDIKAMPSLSERNITKDLENARFSLKYSWGTSTASVANGNAIKKAQPHTVKMSISYDPIKESFIKERVKREKRFGKVTAGDNIINFEIDVVDPRELVPWIRSFYGRIITVRGVENDRFVIKDDLNEIQQQLISEIPPKAHSNSHSFDGWSLTEEQKEELGKNHINDEPHKQLFSEMFSVYNYIAADALMQLCYSGSSNKAMSNDDIKNCVQKAFERYKDISGHYTEYCFKQELLDELKNTGIGRFQSKCFVPPVRTVNLFSGSFSDKTSYDMAMHHEEPQSKEDAEALLPLYAADQSLDFYRDLLPLTKLECRWLLTVLNDNKIHYFLTDDEIAAIQSAINPEGLEKWAPFPVDKIKHFDQFSHAEDDYLAEQSVLSQLLVAIDESRIVEINSEKDKPVLLEFSKRDNRFRCYFQAYYGEKIFLVNLSSIKSIKVLDEQFDHSEALSALEEYREDHFKTLTVQFVNERNVPDRILTEFSPWKKECTYDPKEKIYTLTIHYQSNDKNELLIRLMSYGAGIYFPDKEDPICQEITKRVERQIKIFTAT